MKGYKGMNADMTCRGMPYKVGHNTVTDSEEPCIDVHLKERKVAQDAESDECE